MVYITGTAQRDAWLERVLPPIEQIHEHVWSVPIAFHDNPVRHTYTYLLTNPSGECIVVDPGWDSAEGRTQLNAGLERARISLDSVVGVVATHFHPDHLGMARYVAEGSGAWVGMHRIESDALDQLPNGENMIREDREWLQVCGVPDTIAENLVTGPSTVTYVSNLARATLSLEHSTFLPFRDRRLQVVLTPGHTAGHICIIDHDSRVVLTGDHVLPRISPNIGLTSADSGSNPLGKYYESLDLIARWDEFEACPAHEYRFRGLAGRTQALRQHHKDRSAELVVALNESPGLSVWEIAGGLNWSRGWASLDGLNLRSALAETNAHVEYLLRAGAIVHAGRHPNVRTRLVSLPGSA